MFGSVLDKGRLLVVEGDNVYFITGIGRSVGKDDCHADVTIK